MRHTIKIILKVIGCLALVVGISFSIFSIITIKKLPLENFESRHSGEKVNDASPTNFEEGSLVKLSELQLFYKLSLNSFPFKKWLSKKINNEEIEKVGKREILFSKDVLISPLSENSCKDVYCYQNYVHFNHIPAIFWKGLIGIEDYRFLEHSGVDPKSIARAIFHDLKELKLAQGGSTLTQQLVKNLFYSNDKKFIRKIKEMIASVYFETKHSKEDILELYFNETNWGSVQGIKIKGIYAASIFYFQKRPEEIDPFEAAILIGLLKGPYYYSPFNRLERLKKRANIVYNKLKELQLFPSGKSYQWGKRKWKNWKKRLTYSNSQNNLRAMWWSRKNKSKALNDYEKFIFVKTSLDVLSDIKKKYPKKDIVVKAILNNGLDEDSFKFYSKFERKKERAIEDERHQVGSLLKPILYGIFLNNGITLDREIETGPIELKLKSGLWSPKESHKNLPPYVSLEEALHHSYNRPVVKLAKEIGFENLQGELEGLLKGLKTPLSEYPAQLLGAVELSLSELQKLYLHFFKSECLRDEEKNLIFVMSDPSKTTIRKMVNKKFRNLQFFGKTGTSNNGYDNWFLFFDGNTRGVIYVGLEGDRSKDELALYGGTTSFRIFQNFFGLRGKRFNELTCHFLNNRE